MRWLLSDKELTDEVEERAFLGGLHDADFYVVRGRVILELEENNSQVQGRVLAAFPEAERLEGVLEVFYATSEARMRANQAVLGDKG